MFLSNGAEFCFLLSTLISNEKRNGTCIKMFQNFKRGFLETVFSNMTIPKKLLVRLTSTFTIILRRHVIIAWTRIVYIIFFLFFKRSNNRKNMSKIWKNYFFCRHFENMHVILIRDAPDIQKISGIIQHFFIIRPDIISITGNVSGWNLIIKLLTFSYTNVLEISMHIDAIISYTMSQNYNLLPYRLFF